MHEQYAVVVQVTVYAMALTRLVNGVVDPLQQKAHAASVHQLALEQGLPASLVDVRHECTHNRLPSLPTLRLGAEQALLWLCIRATLLESTWRPREPNND